MMKRKHDEMLDSEREGLLERIRVGDRSCFQWASEEMKADREVALAAISLNAYNLNFLPNFRDDEEIMVTAVRQHGSFLSSASSRLQGKKAIVMTAISSYGESIEYASLKLRSDYDVVMAAINKEWSCLKYASSELLGDKIIVMAAINKSGYALQYASPELQADPGIVMAAVNNDGYALKFASPQLQADHDIVMAAVRNNGFALMHVPPNLQGDYGIVMAAINQNGNALRYASTELRGERDVVLAAIRSDSRALEFASDAFKADEDMVMTAIRNYPSLLQHAASTLRSNFGFVARVIRATRSNGFSEQPLCYTTSVIKEAIQDVYVKFNYFPETRAFLNDSQQVHSAFMEFLCCVRSELAARAGNPVTMVNLDTETSKKLHRHIAEYAGVPLGPGLEPVRLVKRMMPIMVAVYENRGANEQNLYWLMEISGMGRPDTSDYHDESDDDY